MMRPDDLMNVLRLFSRHDRDYCIFSFCGSPHSFLYFNHRNKDVRALFYGSGFLDEIPHIEQNPDHCIECGLGSRIQGGVSLDSGDIVTWHCTVQAANKILARLVAKCGDDGTWIEFFSTDKD